MRSKRIDSSGYLYHWVRANPYIKGEKEINYDVAYKTFLKILRDGFLKPGSAKMTADVESICFTESPEYFSEWDQSRYQPFGFKFVKKRIYEYGGRPVIYGSYEDKKELPPSLKWRFAPHLPMDIKPGWPFGLDYTWEREWRLRTGALDLLDAINVIVPDESFASKLETDVINIISENSAYYWGGSGDARDDEEYRDYFSSIWKRVEYPSKFQEIL